MTPLGLMIERHPPLPLPLPRASRALHGFQFDHPQPPRSSGPTSPGM